MKWIIETIVTFAIRNSPPRLDILFFVKDSNSPSSHGEKGVGVCARLFFFLLVLAFFWDKRGDKKKNKKNKEGRRGSSKPYFPFVLSLL